MANYISGLSSGLDWSSMISQLLQLERRPITLLENDKAKLSTRSTAWNEVNTKLLAIKSSVSALSGFDAFNLHTPSATVSGSSRAVDDLVGFAVGSNAGQGTYSLVVDSLASAEKLGSRSFGSVGDALGISGDILINGRTVNIEETNTLADISSKINALNSGANPAGVTASILSVGQGEYRLTLTSQDTGAAGISIANGSAQNVLGQLGLTDSSLSLRTAITGGAQSFGFASSSQDIQSLLGLNSAAAASVTIEGETIAIDLSADSLESIRDTINSNANLQAQGIRAAIVSRSESETTTYRLQINGTQSLSDSDNILQTLGFLKQGNSAVSGLVSAAENTTGGAVITQGTLLADVDGYTNWTAGDTITIAGTDHGGDAVGPIDFTITETATVGELLTAIETAFGGMVSAAVNSSGAIVLEDAQAGESSLSLSLMANLSDGTSTLDFGTFDSSIIRNRQITAGEDARIILDGTTITKATNQISDVIAGVTLTLQSEDPDAEITLTVSRDYDGIKEKISEFVTKYNDLMTYISTQFTAGEEGGDTPALFADSSLMSVRSTIRNVILSGVEGLESSLTHLSLIGITSDRSGKLSIDSSVLDGYLRSNFNDVVNLFVVQGTSSNSNLTYLRSGRTTEGGSYEIEITQAASRATVVGSGFSGALSEDALLTITDGSGREVSVNLSAGWNITAIVNAINSELSQAEGSAPAVTAQNADGELQLINDAYGDYSFTVAVTGGNLGLADGTYTGVDVAGRIREEGSEIWMTMTGKGQTLTGDEDQGAEGLVVRYAGSDLGTFDFQFITGIGEKLDRALYFMTDSIDGYVAGKKKSLLNRMNSIDLKIETVERRIEKREEALMKQFITMERLVAQMQSQQQWLSNQIGIINSQWNQNS